MAQSNEMEPIVAAAAAASGALVVLVVLCCSQIRTVKVFAREEHEDSNYGKQIDEAYKLGAKV